MILTIQRFARAETRIAAEGVGFSDFFVVQVDDDGRYVGQPLLPSDAWLIEPRTNQELEEFTYGETPEGWEEIQPAPELKMNEWYLAGEFYFRISERDGKMAAHVMHISEFMEQRYERK